MSRLTFCLLALAVLLSTIVLPSASVVVVAAPIPITEGPASPNPRSTSASRLPAPTHGAERLASLQDFRTRVRNGKANTAVGIYVPQQFAYSITQQPANDPGYVSTRAEQVTQFGLARRYGVTGLLAHNSLAGAAFGGLTVGQEVDLVQGDGRVLRYRVKEVRRFRALSPTDPYSKFEDLDRSGSLLSSMDLFLQVYTGKSKLVFQTCIAANGDPTWGRLFVIATPISAS